MLRLSFVSSLALDETPTISAATFLLRLTLLVIMATAYFLLASCEALLHINCFWVVEAVEFRTVRTVKLRVYIAQVDMKSINDR